MFDASGLKISDIETRKSEHYVAHMNLNKEQIAILAHDLSQLRQDVLQLQNEVGLARGQDRLRDRLAFLEEGTGDFSEKHTKAMDAIKRSHHEHRTSLEARLSNVEDTVASLEECVRADRVACVEQQQRDSTDKCAKDLQILHELLQDQFESRLAEVRCESVGWRASVARRVGALEEMFYSKQVDVSGGQLLRHRRWKGEGLEACEKLWHREPFCSHDRVHTITTELQREADSKVVRVNQPTSSASSPSLSTASPEPSPGGQSSPLSFARQNFLLS